MLPNIHQPRQLYGTAKSHKLKNNEEITLRNLNLHRIIAQSGTYTNNAALVIR